jgi:hypothetical protein
MHLFRCIGVPPGQLFFFADALPGPGLDCVVMGVAVARYGQVFKLGVARVLGMTHDGAVKTWGEVVANLPQIPEQELRAMWEQSTVRAEMGGIIVRWLLWNEERRSLS